MREPLVTVDSTPAEPAPRTVALSNLDKVFWPDEGYTKGDLIAYYRTIAPWLHNHEASGQWLPAQEF